MEVLQHVDDRLAALVFAEEAVVVDAVLGEQGRESRAVIGGDRRGETRQQVGKIGHGRLLLAFRVRLRVA